jgi:hypothetical protein
MKNKTNTILATSILTIGLLASTTSLADNDWGYEREEHGGHEREEHGGGHEREEHEGSFFSRMFGKSSSNNAPYKRFMDPVNNPLYKNECGACHFAFLPELLPQASWQNILNNLDNHFGEDASLDQEVINEILVYLKSNSAEKSGAKRAVKFMRSLSNGETPKSITSIPYMQREHRKIDLQRIKGNKKIGTLSNCTACHADAEKGNFDDD